MADILPFKKPRPKDKHKGKFMCRSGFHKWAISQEKQFDSKSGRLVTIYRCNRCGSTKVKNL